MTENLNARMETFCDGVFAIAITLLILEVKSPIPENVHTSGALWVSLKHLLPSIYAFLLSFTVILISWVNHHTIMKLVNKHTPQFIYSNGLLLLSIAFIPFPTALLAEFVFTDAASPAVVLYSMAILFTNISWILVSQTALKPKPLTINEVSKKAMEDVFRKGIYAFILYLFCTILAFWLPLVSAIIITLTWLAWLIIGINIKDQNNLNGI